MLIAVAVIASTPARVFAHPAASGHQAHLTFGVQDRSLNTSTIKVGDSLPWGRRLTNITHGPLPGLAATSIRAPLAEAVNAGATTTVAPRTLTVAIEPAAQIAARQYQDLALAAGALPAVGEVVVPLAPRSSPSPTPTPMPMPMPTSATSSTWMAMTGPMWMPNQTPTMARLLAWHPQPIPVLPMIVLVLLVLYGWGVIVLHRRGIHWPIHRSIWWLVGLASILMVTATGIDGYGMELFSVHMIQHMVLNMLSPVFLVLGAPVTLLLRALPAGSGRRGRTRRGVLWLMHTRAASFLVHPVVLFTLFIMTLYGVYFTAVFDYLMGTWWGHNLMLVHFLLIGFLYFWAVLGIDPSPRRSRRGVSMVLGSVLELGVLVPFHAFFGVVVMMSTTLLVRFYAVPVPGWNTSPLTDQVTGGAIAWSFTELPTILVLGALVLKWQKSDQRSTRAKERRQAIGGDTELADYNSYLQARSRADQAQR